MRDAAPRQGRKPRGAMWSGTTVLASCACLAAVLAGCQREARTPRRDPAVEAALDAVAPLPNRIGGAPPLVFTALGKPYEDNAYALAEGKRLFNGFSCRQCHGDGSGTEKGPSFIDGWWNYGPDFVSIVLSIRDGRPHGMPAFRDKLTTEQIWQIAGYLRALGSNSAKTSAPGREDAPQNPPAAHPAPAPGPR